MGSTRTMLNHCAASGIPPPRYPRAPDVKKGLTQAFQKGTGAYRPLQGQVKLRSATLKLYLTFRRKAAF